MIETDISFGKLIITVNTGEGNELARNIIVDDIIIKDKCCSSKCTECPYSKRMCKRLANTLSKAIEIYKERQLLEDI